MICGDLLEWLRDWSSANPTMADYVLEVQGSNNFSVQEADYLSWFSVYVGIPEDLGSNASKEMDFLAIWEEASKEQKLSS